MVQGNSYGIDFDNAKNFTKDAVSSGDVMVKKFKGGRIQLFVEAEEVGHYLLKKNGIADYHVVISENSYIGISKKSPKGQELFDKIAKALKELEQSGELDKIVNSFNR